jgi:hypothetical protein
VDQFTKKVQEEIATMEAAAKQEWTDKKEMSQQETTPQKVEIAALAAVSPRVLLTPQFIAKHQNEDTEFNKIIIVPFFIEIFDITTTKTRLPSVREDNNIWHKIPFVTIFFYKIKYRFFSA